MNMLRTFNLIVGMLNGLIALILLGFSLYDFVKYDRQPTNIIVMCVVFNCASWIVNVIEAKPEK